jgi:hypothetical protein
MNKPKDHPTAQAYHTARGENFHHKGAIGIDVVCLDSTTKWNSEPIIVFHNTGG